MYPFVHDAPGVRQTPVPPNQTDDGPSGYGLEEVARELASMFPSSCAAAIVDVATAAPEQPSERAFILHAAERRRREFRAGRHAARLALKSIGCTDASIPVGPSREPIWPQHVAGSISHSGALAVAVVAPTTLIHSVGIDIEANGAVGRDLWPLCFSPAEQASLHQLDADRALTEASILFSAKESVFKALFPILRRWVDFPEVEIALEWSNHRFHVSLPAAFSDDVPGRQPLCGAFRVQPCRVLTGVVVSRS